MTLTLDAIAKLLSPLLVALIGAIAKRYFEAKPKLITYLVNASAIPVDITAPGGKKTMQVHTHSIVVRNTGKKTAHNVRIGHSYLPPSYQIFPQVTHEVVQARNNAAEIVVPTLVPNEQVSISYLYFPPITWQQINSYTKSDECMAKTITIIPSPQWNKALLYFTWSLVFIGASVLLYWLFLLVAWLLT